MNVANKTIVITGAAAGVGRALAIECARCGALVALADVNLEGVLATRHHSDHHLQEPQLPEVPILTL